MANAKTTPFGQLSFPNLFVARAMDDASDPRFSTLLLLDEEAQQSVEYQTMKSEVMRVAKEKWGEKAVGMFKNGQLRSPFRDATEKDQYAGFEQGKIYVNLWTKQKPGVIDGKLNDVPAEEVYAGCIARCTYGCFAYDRQGNKGVAFGLNNVQISDFTAPRLDGKVAANKDFDVTDMKVADMPDGDQTSGEGSGTDDDGDLPF